MRSREDTEALALLEQKSVRVTVDGVSRYAVPLLRRRNSPLLNTSPNAVIPLLRAADKVLASQYDSLGFLIPYTARAKVLVQALWKGVREWDEPIKDELLPLWCAWESELPQIR